VTPAACVSPRLTARKRYTGVRSGMASGVGRPHQSVMERQLPELLSLKEPCYEMEGQLRELPQEVSAASGRNVRGAGGGRGDI
jgi:hypothetical protein